MKIIRLLTVNIDKQTNIIYLHFFLLINSLNYCYSQNKNQLFFNYLIKNKFYSEAEICLRNNPKSFSTDSFNINFIICKTNTNQLDSSLYFLNKMDLNNYPKLMLLQNNLNICYKNIYINKTPKNYFKKNDSLSEYFLIQSLGSKLLNDSVISDFTAYNFKYNISTYQNLQNYNIQKINIVGKKPILAAIYSSLIPGLGKLYCHKKKQAFASFAINTIFVAQAVESYLKLGPQSARFIVFTSIGSIFYLSNFFGSYFIAKKYKKNKKQMINNSIKNEL